MGRPVVLSNGQLFVGLDESGLVHDFYYPYVGLDNLTNARSSQHKIGVWVEGNFSWVGGDGWDMRVDFRDDALISCLNMHSASLAVTVECTDFIDPEYNVLVRRIHITNNTDRIREIRLFMHQVFQISRAGRADTAMYVPDDHYILDYKGRCCLLIAGKMPAGQDFDQYAVGNYAIEGKAGTFVDAVDGELSENAVEHGGVDSVIRFCSRVPANGAMDVDYWVIAADSQSDAAAIHAMLKRPKVTDERLAAAQEFWNNWLQPAATHLTGMPEAHRKMVQKSLLIIKAHCDERGSILASGDSSIFNYGRDYYCYCWPRDAAYAVWPLMRLGLFGEARKFFDFARDTMHRDGYLMHKYQPDRAIGSTWHPLLHNRARELAIQEDETATVLFMLGEYYRLSNDRTYIESIFDSFIAPCANFMSNYTDGETGLPHASYDLWEQSFLTSTYTVSTVIAGLEAASDLADMLERSQADVVHWRHVAAKFRANLEALYHPNGYFRKGFILETEYNMIFDDKLDISSLYGPFMFARIPLDDQRMMNTLKRVEQMLLNSSPVGGVIRDEHDGYFLTKTQYRGNPWIVCTLWLAQYYYAVGRKEDADKLVDWALARAHPSGALSEQFDPESGYAIGVTPLVWSHAEMINTLLDVNSK